MGEWLYGSNRHARQRSPPPPRTPAGRCFHRARTTTPPDGGVAPPEAVSIDRTPQRSTRRANGGDAHRPHLVALAQRARAHLP